MITFQALYKSARIRSLPLSLSGIIMGTALAYQSGFFRWDIFILALLTTTSFQVLSDYANDYGDAQKGTDNAHRLGPVRAVQSGEISLPEMKKVVVATACLALCLAFALIGVAFHSEENFGLYVLFFALLGILCIVFAITYTVGKRAYGYKGLGDIFVFIFFGLVSVLGAYFLQTKYLTALAYFPAISCGLLSVAVLNLNNMRDAQNDLRMGKRTIAARLGFEYAKYYQYFLVLFAMIAMMLYTLFSGRYGIGAAYLLAFVPLVWHLFFVRSVRQPQQYDSQLKVVAFSTFLMSVLFFLGNL